MRKMLLFETANRDESHAKLAEILASGKHPRAECRENPNAAKPYQVWSGPEERKPDA